MKIGALTLSHGLFLAPLAGVTDYAFRTVCRENGAECTVTEMVSSKAVCFTDKKTTCLARIRSDDRPCGIQLFGSDPECMAKAAALLSGEEPDFFDINMGCPVPKVVNSGDGSALMKTPSLCGEIVNAVCSAVSVPVTVKIRLGYDRDSINAPSVAEICQQNGAMAVFVHGRTRAQMYSGKADYDAIRAVRQSVTVPVVGNGDIFCADDALHMLEQTGCAGIMVARGSLGNPWIFREIICRLEGREFTPPTAAEKIATIKKQTLLLAADRGDRAIVEMRKQLAWYTKGMKGSAALRRDMNAASSVQDVFALAEKAFN